ncbi:MAG: hypothetical protein ACON4R_11550 [Akkermansiaceae bacterium]
MTTNEEEWERICEREEAEHDPFLDDHFLDSNYDIVGPQQTSNDHQKEHRRPSGNTSAASSGSGSSKKNLGELSKRECGALWEKEDRHGEPYFGGSIKIDGVKTDITVLKNLNQDETKNTPHWRVFWK